MEIRRRLDSVFAEAVYTFIEVCRVRRYAPEPILFADLGRLPGRYRGAAGWGWAFRLPNAEKLMAVAQDGTLYWATRTWRLQDQPPELQHIVGDYFLIAQAEAQVEKDPVLCHDVMKSLVRFVELRETGEELQFWPKPRPQSMIVSR